MSHNIWLFILLCALFVLFLLVNDKRKKERQARQILGLSWLHNLKEFLSHTQQHRGLTSSYLNGNKALLADIEILERRASKDIINIESLGSWVPSNLQWQGITQHWARLSKSYRSGDFGNNLTQHNHLIQNLLYFIDDMAVAHDLLLMNKDKQKSFHFAWRELLPVSEYIGQARALGIGAVTKKTCGSVERIRLNYLYKKISESTDIVWTSVPPEDGQRACVEKLLDCLINDVIQADINIEPNDYFEIATQALDVMHQQYDKLVEEKRWQLT
jgi:hypothetical protein